MAGENVSSPAIQTAQQTISSPSPAGAPTAAGPPVAVNLSAQAQNYPQSLSHGQIPLKPGSARPFVQNVPQPQQVTSPAMLVQSPPQSATSALPRSSSAGRISPNTTGALRPGQFSIPQQQQQLQQQQAHMLANRASQGQAVPSSQQRPTQSSQTPNLQGGQLTSQGLMAASSPMRPVYPPYTQMMRPGMGGQPAISMQYMMQGRAKPGQVSSQFPTGTGVGPISAMAGVGMPMTRPSGSVMQQSQPTQRMQVMQSRQPQPLQQPQQAQPQSSLQMQQKMAGQMPKVPSTNSLQSSLPASQSPGGTSNLPTQTGQQAWGLKPANSMSSPQGISAQQAALLKQGQLLYAHQMQGPQLHQASMNQQHQLGRAPSSTTQRPVTPTGMQPSTPGMATPTSAPGALTGSLDSGNRVLGKRTIQDLAAQVDPSRRLDPEVEDLLLDIADDFVESVTTFACKLAKHRKSNILEAKDILLHLNRSWDISIPGFGAEEYHAFKKTSWNETHKQRLALVKKSIAAAQQAGDSVAANNKPSGGSTQSITAAPAAAQAPTTV